MSKLSSAYANCMQLSPRIRPEAVQKLDAVDSIPDLQKVGQAVAAKKVDATHFQRFPARA
jgi:hypothetical protein